MLTGLLQAFLAAQESALSITAGNGLWKHRGPRGVFEEGWG